MKSAYICVLFSICISKAFSNVVSGTCAQDPIIPDFDAVRYSGKWYEIERIDYIFEQNLECVTAEYGILNSTFVSVKNGGFDM